MVIDSLLDPHFARMKTGFPECCEVVDCINLVDYKVVEISKSYDLFWSVDHDEMIRLMFVMPSFKFEYSSVRRVLVLDCKGVLNEGSVRNYTVFALFGNGVLAFWRFVAQNWCIFEHKGYNKIVDIIDHKRGVYGVKRGGMLVKVDMEACTILEYAAKPWGISRNYELYYLVSFKDRLYMVTFYRVTQVGAPMISLKVYVLNEETISWELANDLGGAALFVGHDNVFPVPAKDLGLPEGSNLVYFEGYTCYNNETGREEVCSLEYNLNYGCTLINNWWPNRAPFWPPPEWIKQTTR